MKPVLIVVGVVIALWVVGGIYRQRHGKNKIIRVIDGNCTGCQRCISRCHYLVLDKLSSDKSSHVFVKDPSKCTGCGDCISVCKFEALELVDRQQL